MSCPACCSTCCSNWCSWCPSWLTSPCIHETPVERFSAPRPSEEKKEEKKAPEQRIEIAAARSLSVQGTFDAREERLMGIVHAAERAAPDNVGGQIDLLKARMQEEMATGGATSYESAVALGRKIEEQQRGVTALIRL